VVVVGQEVAELDVVFARPLELDVVGLGVAGLGTRLARSERLAAGLGIRWKTFQVGQLSSARLFLHGWKTLAFNKSF